MKVTRYELKLEEIPVDFFADPDGDWTYDSLTEASGFDPETQGICIGALTQRFRGHPEGSAVVTITARKRPYVAVIECEGLPSEALDIVQVA